MLPPSPSAHRSRKIGFSFDDIENEGAPVEPLEVEAKCDNAANHRAWMAGAMVSALAFVLLGVTIALDEHASEPPSGERDLSSPVGWVGLFSAVLLFGSVGVMVKIPSVMEADVDPMSFQIYQSAGIVFVSLVVLLYEIFQEHGHTSSLKLSWWGVMGAAIIYVAQAFAYNGVRGLGNAVGPATWAGIGMCVSFTWGVGLYREGVGSVGECIAALAVLVSGIFGVALSPTTLPQQILACLNGGKPNVTTNTPLASRDGRDESVATILASVPDVTANEDKKAEEAPTISRRQGLMCALMVGLVDGSLMVPYKAFLKAEDENDITSAAATLRSAANATRGLSVDTVARLLRHSPTGNGTSASTSRGVSLENSYVISLGMGLLIVAPVFSLLYIIFVNHGKWPPMKFRQGCPAGFATGLFWAVANMGSVHATKYLGMSLGFPLTQTCICINGMWGILFYQEIRGIPNIALYSLCTIAIIGGAVLLTQACAS